MYFLVIHRKIQVYQLLDGKSNAVKLVLREAWTKSACGRVDWISFVCTKMGGKHILNVFFSACKVGFSPAVRCPHENAV